MKTHIFSILLLLLTGVCALGAQVDAEPSEALKQRFRDAMVFIDLFNYPELEERVERGNGTGFCIDQERQWIVTNAHVVNETAFACAIDTRGNRYILEPLHVSTQADFAICQVIPNGQTRIEGELPLFSGIRNKRVSENRSPSRLHKEDTVSWSVSSRDRFVGEDKKISEKSFKDFDRGLYWRNSFSFAELGLNCRFPLDGITHVPMFFDEIKKCDSLPGDSGSPIVECIDGELRVVAVHCATQGMDSLAISVPVEFIYDVYESLINAKNVVEPIINAGVWGSFDRNGVLIDNSGVLLRWIGGRCGNFFVEEVQGTLLESPLGFYRQLSSLLSRVDLQTAYAGVDISVKGQAYDWDGNASPSTSVINVRAKKPLSEEALTLSLPDEGAMRFMLSSEPLNANTGMPLNAIVLCVPPKIDEEIFVKQAALRYISGVYMRGFNRFHHVVAINATPVQTLKEVEAVLALPETQSVSSLTLTLCLREGEHKDVVIPFEGEIRTAWAKAASEPWTQEDRELFLLNMENNDNDFADIIREGKFEELLWEQNNKYLQQYSDKYTAKGKLTRTYSFRDEGEAIVPEEGEEDEGTPAQVVTQEELSDNEDEAVFASDCCGIQRRDSCSSLPEGVRF